MNRTESTRLLDRAWSVLESGSDGYVYAKDIPEIISFIDRELPSKLTTQSNDKVIESWVNNDPMKTLSKEQFLEAFSMLVGTSFDTAVQIAMQSDILTPTRRGASLFGSYRRSSNDLEQVLPAEQIKALKRELQEWKDKYTFLSHEFQFFLSQEKKNPEVIDNTKHEFIISELNRKLREQDEAIEDLKSQLDYGLVPELKDKTNWIKALQRKAYNYLLPKILICLLLLLLYYCLAAKILFTKSSSTDDVPSFIRQQSWWERNKILSRIQWYFKDRIENNVVRNSSEVIQNYNSVFGIH